MKHLKHSLTSLSALAIVLGVAACASDKPAEPNTAAQAQRAPGAPGAPGDTSPSMSAGTTAGGGPIDYGAPAPTPAATATATGTSPTDVWGHGVAGSPKNQMGATNAMAAGDGAAVDVTSLNDAQLAAVVGAINAGEIQEAQLALNKATSPDVKRYARDMVSAHHDMQARSAAMLDRLQIIPSDSAASTQLKNDTQNELSTLQTMRGKDFDRDYVDAQVRNHSKALDLMDRITPNVKNAELKAAMTADRPKVEGHLRMAERIQQSLQKNATNVP